MLLIGSQALRIGLEKVGKALGRVPADFDLFVRPTDIIPTTAMGLSYVSSTSNKTLFKASDGKMFEVEVATPGSSTELYLDYAEKMAVLPQTDVYGMKADVAPLDMLYSIKRAHRHSPRRFERHVKDYNYLRQLCGTDSFARITKLRYQETVEREKLRTPSLNKSTMEFFDDAISNRTFVHDQIHEVMAFGNRPLFERIKIDPNKVTCSKEKFLALSGEERDHCVQEEAYVIALERGIIPMLFADGPMVTPIGAYKWALMRICTTLCSGWFREYALENYDNLMLKYNWGYTHKFLDAVESGRIERIK